MLTNEESAWWDLYIDWEKRISGENGFFARQLSCHGVRKVFDACMGTGCDTIQLLKGGFEVVGNVIDENQKRIASANASEYGLTLNTTSFDWRSIPADLYGTFDGVINLGNSLTCLLHREDHLIALKNFYQLLRAGGVLIIDQRNYDYILNQREHILQNPCQNFRYSGRYYYCGKEVISYPIDIKDNQVVLEFLHIPTGKILERSTYYPFRRQELIDLLYEAGFKEVETFSDFKRESSSEADFYQHVVRR